MTTLLFEKSFNEIMTRATLTRDELHGWAILRCIDEGHFSRGLLRPEPQEAPQSKTNLSNRLMATLLFEKSFSEIITRECKAHSRRAA